MTRITCQRLDTLQTQILRSRGFDAYVTAAILSECIFWVDESPHSKLQWNNSGLPNKSISFRNTGKDDDLA